MDLNNARFKYYLDKQEACMVDLTKAHLKVYEMYMDRRLEDQEEIDLFEKVYKLIKENITDKGLIKGKQKES